MSPEVAPPQKPVSTAAGWQRSKRVRPVPQHTWQIALPPEKSSGERWRPLRFVGLLVVLAVLMGAFLVVAMDAPQKTPFLIVTDLRPGRIPQSPWLAEEIARLKLLDNTTLMVREHTLTSSVGTDLSAFRQSLRELSPAAEKTGAVMIYVRLPGLVDDAGRPCLVPPQASLVQAEEWLPLEPLLDHIAGDAFPTHVQRLVIFDRCQPAHLWSAGVLADTFGDQLARLMKRQHDAGRWRELSVLADTSGRQKGWHSPATGGSVFGEAVWSALAGRANATESSGDGDQHVSLSELATFVIRRTSGWVQANRQQIQTPIMLSSADASASVCWAAPTALQQEWQAKADHLRTIFDRDSALQRMSKLWNQRIVLAEQTPWQFDPVGWQQLNYGLLNYERLIGGGGGAVSQRDDLERAIQSLLDQLKEGVQCRLPLKQGEVRLHHRQLTRRLNSGQSDRGERVANAFDQMRERPTRELVRSVLDDLHRNGGVPQDWDLVVLQHLVNDAPDATWSHPELMSRVLGLLDALGDVQALSEVTVSRMLKRQSVPVEADLRAILDRLFVGTDDDLALAQKWLSVAETKLATCQQAARQLTLALTQRDRAAAELPRLAEWIFAPQSGAEERLIRQRISEWSMVTQCWKELEQALDVCHEQGCTAESVALAVTLSSQVERALDGMWDGIDQTYDRLLTDTVDAGAVAEMEHMLSTSLLPRKPDSRSRSPVEQRMSLYETWQQATIQLDLQHAHALSWNSPLVPHDAPAPDDWMLQIVRGAAPHPMAFLLSLGDPSADPAAAPPQTLRDDLLSKSGERAASIRHYLAAIPQRLHRDRFTSFDTPELRDRAWQWQARQVRHAARWLPHGLPCNPCQRTELAAWSAHLRQRAACMAEDFWFGPADSPVPFFVQAATDLLDAADLCEASFASSLTAAGKSGANAIRQRLAQAQSPDRPGLFVTAVAVPQILSTDPLQTNVSVTRPAEALIPAGTAAVLISTLNHSDENTTLRAAAELPALPPATTDPITARVNLRCPMATIPAASSSVVRARAFFRGHQFADNFQLAPTDGLTVRSIPPAVSRTTVTVQSQQRRPNAILFILDASASMTDTVPREGTRGSVRKLDAAVEALTSLLNDLAEQPEVQVGVMLYGHRVASGETAAAGVVRQPLYLQRYPFPTTLQPFEDVETILSLGRFGGNERGQVADRLRALQPWGETPLYLSIVQGLQQFESLPSDVTKTMVVITDGLNYQFNPSPEKQTQLDDVLQSVPGRDVAVHLVGFGIADQQIEQARLEFSRISAATGGSSDVTVRDAGRLQAYLRTLYQPARFSVEGDNGFQRTAQVGQPIVLPQPTANEEAYTVRFAATASRIAVAGGEKLVFRPAEDGTLQIATDLPERSVSLQQHASGQSAPCEIVASRPVWKGDRLTVRWSLRQRDGQFTPRPSIGYFLLQPLDATGTEIGTAAVCVGLADLPGCALPTWEFQLPAWPRTAVTARVRGWITTAPINAERVESCATLLQKQAAGEAWQALPLPAVGWQIRQDGSSVTLVERYDTVTSEPAVWTECRGDQTPSRPALLHVERRFDPEHRLFVQTWNFERDLTPADLASLRFQFSRIESLRAQSWDMASALFLPVVTETLVIQPVPVMRR